MKRECSAVGKDPARALELADPAQALDPRGVEDLLFRDVLGRQAGGGGLSGSGAW